MRQRLDLRRLVLALVLIPIAGFAIHRVCVIPYRANLVMRDVEERMRIVDSVDSVQANSLARLNMADLELVAEARRLDPAWYLYYGANCEILDRWQDAADAYTNGLAVDQRPELYFSRGLVMLHLERLAEAEADMITAVRFNEFLLDQIDGELRNLVAAKAGVS
jgi:hypothetical protein